MRTIAVPQPIPPGCRHAEAFRLLRYRSDNRDGEELVWNARDGLAPEVIALLDGTRASHVNWSGDLYLPDHRPAPGERVFVDLHPERVPLVARKVATRLLRDARSPLPVPADQLHCALEVLLLREALTGAAELRVVTDEFAAERGWA